MAVIYTSTVSGKTYGFDFADQRIDVDATVDTMLVTHLWTAIKEAQAVTEGMSYDIIARGGGTDELGTGVTTYLTVTLLDNWEVNTLKSSGKFEVTGGNLIREDGADPFRDNPLITYIAFLSQAGIATQIETGISGVTPQDIQDFKNAVFTEVIEGAETFKDQQKLMRAALVGLVSKSGNTFTFRDAQNLIDRIIADTDQNGQRLSVTTDTT